MTKKGKSNKLSSTDYEELGRRLENIYTAGYINKKEMLKMSFLKGLATGFGGVVGATIVVGILLWIFGLFETIPLIGPFVDNITQTIESSAN